MSSLLKIIIAAVLIVVSVWWIAQGSSVIITRSGLADLIVILNGSIPIFIILLGLLIVWLEWDNIKTRKEISKEGGPSAETANITDASKAAMTTATIKVAATTEEKKE